MDTVWIDTMYPGIDPDEGWEKNLERVVNYDYLLKEYLDWQLKHLTTDNFNPTDWANVTADIISMAAQSVDLTAYYTKDEADNKSQLLLQAAEDYTQAQLASYYTANEVDSAISTQAGLTLTTAEGYVDTQLLSYYTANQVDGAISAQAVLSQAAAEGYTNTALGSYYTKTEIGDFTGYQTAVAALQAYADNAVATIDLSAYYSKTDVDGMFTTSEASVKGYADGKIAGLSLQAVNPEGGTAHLALMSGNTELGSGANLGLSVTNNSNGYSYVKLKSGGIDLATSGNITLGGNVVFASGSGDTKNLSYTTISGGTVTTNTITALNITANNIKANAVISGPLIYGGIFYATQGNNNDYFRVTSNGWDLYTDGQERASLTQGTNILTLSLGNTTPGKVVKYYGKVADISSSNRNYLWIGGQAYPWNTSTCVGLLIDLDYQNYKLYGTAK